MGIQAAHTQALAFLITFNRNKKYENGKRFSPEIRNENWYRQGALYQNVTYRQSNPYVTAKNNTQF